MPPAHLQELFELMDEFTNAFPADANSAHWTESIKLVTSKFHLYDHR